MSEAERTIAVGLATFLPMMSLATCRHPGSKSAYSRPMLQPGTTPGPPTRAAPTLLMMLPKSERGRSVWCQGLAG